MATPAVAEELQRIHDAAGGRLKASAVVEAARDPRSVLHPHFQWDDSLAAEAHRLNQARRLIASVTIVHHRENITVRSVSYVRDPRLPVNEQGYVAVRSLKSDKDAARDAVMAEFARANSALLRARSLAVQLGIEGQLEDALRSVNLLRAAAQSSVAAEQ